MVHHWRKPVPGFIHRRETRRSGRSAKRPVCYECGEHIQDDECWEMNGELICTDCLEANHKKCTEDYIE